MAPPDEECALAVELASICKALNVLPKAGGILDQDSYHMYLLNGGLNALARLEREESKKS